jgi:hypothetical protein
MSLDATRDNGIMFKTRMLVAVVMATIALPSMASSILLSKNTMYFDKNANTRDIVEVRNVGPEKKAYFKTELREVLNPQKGTKSEYSTTKDPSELGLFVTPNKAVLSPQQKSVNISVVNTNKELEKERVYRVDVTPVIPRIENSGEVGAKFKVLMAYDILIHVQPENPIQSFEHRYDEERFYFSNTGNTHVELRNGKQCTVDDVCSELPNGKVYADNTVKATLLPDTSRVEYDLVTRGVGVEHVVFPKM